MNAVTPVTSEQINAILDRFEQGRCSLEDVNCLRNYLRGLRSLVRAAALVSDDDLDEEPT